MKINVLNLNIAHDNKTSFKSHPDFHKLAKDYDILASNYFRRGGFYGSASSEFPDVIYSLKTIFDKNTNGIKKMLIGGIGESQEPFSLLAVIKHLLKQEPIDDKLELNIIDLQSKPRKNKLFEQSYVDDIKPRYVADSFIRDEGEQYGFKSYMHYRVKDDIFEFLKDTYNDRKKSYWNSRIQEVINKIPDESYDIISVNNTLGYIKDEPIILDTIKHLIRTLKKGGIFITDPFSRFNKACENKAYEIHDGIFKKY